jgi:hypothetical protein
MNTIATLLICGLALLTNSCQWQPSGQNDSTPGPPPLVVTSKDRVRFAVIGDYGRAGANEQAVAYQVAKWRPDFVLTTGDNNYPQGAAETIDANVGRYYHRFISPYRGIYGAGALTNRFFPTLGNHDLNRGAGRPYLDYFTLPGNKRYYDFIGGPVHFFALATDPREPDGVTSTSRQARWLQQRLAASRSPWHIAYGHHPPYSSGKKRASAWMRWPYAEWGVDVVLSGHEHFYERLERDRVTYFVIGLGGADSNGFAPSTLPESRSRFDTAHGALLVEATPTTLAFEFVTGQGVIVDTHRIRRDDDPLHRASEDGFPTPGTN